MADLAQRDGLAAISLRDLADSVGLRQPSLYVYFESKLNLYDAMFADGYRQLLSFLAERSYGGDPRRALARFLGDLVQFSSDDIVRHQMLFQRTIPGFEPSAEAFALALEFYDVARQLLAAVGVTDQRNLDIFSAMAVGPPAGSQRTRWQALGSAGRACYRDVPRRHRSTSRHMTIRERIPTIMTTTVDVEHDPADQACRGDAAC